MFLQRKEYAMKKSRYNYCIPYQDDRFIIFNTLNTTLVVLEKTKFQKFCSTDFFDDSAPENLQFFRNGMLVMDDADEKAIVDFDRAAVAFESSQPHFRILTTTACNARCHYCYEAGAKISTMTPDIATSAVDYIKGKTAGKEKFTLTWFGGEPLLNIRIIDYISKELSRYSEQCGIQWTSSIVTNGSLFTPEIIRSAAKEWNVESVQITLDGMKDKYTQIKNYQDNSSFETVLSNIELLCNCGIRVTLRLNYDQQNYEDITELIKYLSSRLRDCDHWSMYVYPIFDNKDSSYDPKSVMKLVELEELICTCVGKSVRNIALPEYVHGRCVFCSVAGETIMPNGDLMKCCRVMNTDPPFGNISAPSKKKGMSYAKWCTPTLLPKCDDCVFLPICQGGCRAEQFLGQDGCLPRVRTIDLILRAFVDARYSQK